MCLHQREEKDREVFRGEVQGRQGDFGVPDSLRVSTFQAGPKCKWRLCLAPPMTPELTPDSGSCITPTSGYLVVPGSPPRLPLERCVPEPESLTKVSVLPMM